MDDNRRLDNGKPNWDWRLPKVTRLPTGTVGRALQLAFDYDMAACHAKDPDLRDAYITSRQNVASAALLRTNERQSP